MNLLNRNQSPLYVKILLSFSLLLYSLSTVAEIIMSEETFIDNMVNQHGFDRFYLTQLLDQAKVKQSIVRLMTPRRGGKTRPWYKYRRKFITNKRIEQGVDFLRQNFQALKRAEKTYGVPPEIVVAIIGVETIYGRNMGNYRILDALKTLSFYYTRRADFFRDELEHYLLLTREEGLNPLNQKGSYAGAMGIGQFMPSSFRRYAVDFDGDGQRDIWNNNTDAIGSVANYFHQHGWQSGQPVMKPTQVRPSAVDTLLTLKFEPKYTLQQLKRQGLRYHGDEPEQTLSLFIDLETEQGTAYWVGFQNYYVITRYNRSKRYATAVYQLAKEIANRYAQSH